MRVKLRFFSDFDPVDLVTVWVTLLYAVGLRNCGAASIGRSGMESLAYGRALKRSRHFRLHPDHRPRGDDPMGIESSAGD